MKKHLLLLALLLSGISPAQALDVGDISSFMNSDSSTLEQNDQKQYRQWSPHQYPSRTALFTA
ncbi:putative fimbrial protein [Escherichia coli]|uniref:Putative fimbrial protein n=1 Tax=Escherichia coli TaxID=562 RepID=A0A376U3Q6_ECOLX|nr:putative fimbrial protein [Escherichia coli]